MASCSRSRAVPGQMRLVQCPQCGCWFLADAAFEGEACPPCYEGWTPPEGGEPWEPRNAGSSSMSPAASS